MAVPLTDADKLADAQAKYHQLLTGARVVEVDFGTHRTKYHPADADKLAAYVQQLQDKVDGNPRYGAIGVVF